ncbi:hypothetical protein B5M42_003970 [Paenibacillus athensensis]|uniref:Uncharacterized protein n=1 Tax=Paenibacillus athensensis TaxID=1967502 RepID=A0A4Y8PUB8_9BACL|nr:hypothetical protein [Paenibacillus athensensis]MCD1257998.1 hypothetical protein [Paenibacillus athensensis]
MGIQFLDQRISIHRSDSDGTTVLSATPLFIGDLGLQVLAAIPAGNTSNVRVALDGTVGIGTDTGIQATIRLTVERNSNGTAGTGVVILTESFPTAGMTVIPPISVTAADFPPAAAVLAGQIRYTLFIAVHVAEGTITLTGPVVFNGSASAGTTTG